MRARRERSTSPPTGRAFCWKVADTAAGLGQGTLTLTIEQPSGRVFGAIEGPLGPATVDGYSTDGKLTATIAGKDPGTPAFAGTLEGNAHSRKRARRRNDSRLAR